MDIIPTTLMYFRGGYMTRRGHGCMALLFVQRGLFLEGLVFAIQRGPEPSWEDAFEENGDGRHAGTYYAYVGFDDAVVT
jgi:hypothetical protein